MKNIFCLVTEMKHEKIKSQPIKMMGMQVYFLMFCFLLLLCFFSTKYTFLKNKEENLILAPETISLKASFICGKMPGTE